VPAGDLPVPAAPHMHRASRRTVRLHLPLRPGPDEASVRSSSAPPAVRRARSGPTLPTRAATLHRQCRPPTAVRPLLEPQRGYPVTNGG